MGIWEYISQTTGNVDFLAPDKKYKFIDDLSILEIINLVNVGVASYNFKNHVASDIAIDQYFVNPNELQSQNYIDKISNWTSINKMKLNERKTKMMVFNFTNNFQFATRIYIGETLLEIINEMKLLGTIISSDLTWTTNTKTLIKKSYARMQILRKLYGFGVPIQDLVNIYTIYIRSLLEVSCVVWSSSITHQEINSLERIQKVALRIILSAEISIAHARDAIL